MKVVFMGTPDFSVPVLQALIRKHDVICVYTQPPRPAGRGHKLTPSPVQVEAEKHKIPVRYPVSLKNETEQHIFAALDADVAVVCAYGLILPIPVLRAFKGGCINVHASLLPRWRGAAPIQRAIMAGDKETGVTIMQMDAGLDTGDMLLSESTPITPTTTAGQLYDKLSQIGAKLIIEALDRRPTAVHQPTQGVTYANKITKDECLIGWAKPADVLDCHIRALSPYPKAYFMLGEERINVLMAKVVPSLDKEAAPGTFLDDRLTVACGLGTALQLTELQRAGNTPMNADDFLRGFPIKAGTRV